MFYTENWYVCANNHYFLLLPNLITINTFLIFLFLLNFFLRWVEWKWYFFWNMFCEFFFGRADGVKQKTIQKAIQSAEEVLKFSPVVIKSLTRAIDCHARVSYFFCSSTLHFLSVSTLKSLEDQISKIVWYWMLL